MRTLTGIYIYPIKSLGGISLSEAAVELRGFQYDRRWMLIDPSGRFVSQREIPELALLRLRIEGPFLAVFHKANPSETLRLDLEPALDSLTETDVQIWDDTCAALAYPAAINSWFSNTLNMPLQLVYMPDTSVRPTDPAYAPGSMVSFADGYPFLLIGEASLNHLNTRLDTPLPMNRFRPNLVFSGPELPHEEDRFQHFFIGQTPFCGVKPCARCAIPTTDQETGLRAAEPLKTLASYRQSGHKILFGQNVIFTGTNPGEIIRVGDPLTLS